VISVKLSTDIAWLSVPYTLAKKRIGKLNHLSKVVQPEQLAWIL
jgi:hypothetical protein